MYLLIWPYVHIYNLWFESLNQVINHYYSHPRKTWILIRCTIICWCNFSICIWGVSFFIYRCCLLLFWLIEFSWRYIVYSFLRQIVAFEWFDNRRHTYSGSQLQLACSLTGCVQTIWLHGRSGSDHRFDHEFAWAYDGDGIRLQSVDTKCGRFSGFVYRRI